MSRLAKLSLATTVLTFLAVTAGGLVRASGSGLGCPGWPKCYGRWIPPANVHSIIEMTHRYLVSFSIYAAIAVLVSIVLWHRNERFTFRLGLAIVPLFIAQAALGAYVVGRELVWWSVVGHLALAMVLIATLIILTVHLSAGALKPRAQTDRPLIKLLVATGVATYALLLLGSTVTGKGAGLAYRDWPLMNGTAFPSNISQLLPGLQFAHRVVAALVSVLAGVVVVRTWRTGPGVVRRLGVLLGSLFAVEVAVGGVNVFSRLHAASVTTHLAIGAAIWCTLVALWAMARRTEIETAEPPRSLRVSTAAGNENAQRTEMKTKVGAYFALTKPRIIELLLVTTVPTMVVADRGLPSGWLILATLVGGSLAAGGANALNMYIDRDIDRLMDRTKNRPLVTGAVTPTAAFVFALILEAAAFVELWLLVNLLSAVLAVSATAFYVLVYTMWLKRTSKQNIVIGGAAGAVPVLVGWSAVTGSLGLAPLVLFSIIFYWTPPHFWALAIRYRDDYAAADVPMLPVVETFQGTARKILLYTLILWAATLLFYDVGGMGDIYLAAAFVLGGVFTYHAVRLRQQATPALAMRLFGWSISYVTLLFGAMALDQLVHVH
ncbi:MAG: protoheme IX farnesyltransferase [Acidimicrobiia bacterium]|nr:protoheme IX farnesyltransferase [Acidimicrobiia bacterium]